MAERRKIIVLDPAHGGTTDRGSSTWMGGASAGPDPLLEKDVSLALARAVKQRLDGTHDVRLTRDRDVNLSLAERARQARDLGADMFVSIHFNAAMDPAVDGTETWVAHQAGSASRALAQAIPRRLARAAGIADRGVRQADFGVLLPSRHDPRTAACLVEVAFLTNPGEAARLRNAAYLGTLADALSDAVRAPVGLAGAQATPVPVIELTRAQFRREVADFVRGPSGFDAILRGQFTSPQTEISFSGGLMMEESGKRREITPAELKKLAAQTAYCRVYTGRGVNSGTGYEAKVGANGCFTATAMVGLDPGTPRIRCEVDVELKDGSKLTAEGIFRRRDLDGFLQVVDDFEKKRPIGLNDGACKIIAAGHFDFLTAVRKVFQPAKGSPLAPLFDLVLFRNSRICPLLAQDAADGWDMRRFTECQIGNDIVDIGHVLVGIEAYRRQKPDSQLPYPVKDLTHAEAFLGWAGDLGSAVVPYAQSVIAARHPSSTTPKPDVPRPCVTPPAPSKKDLAWYLDQKAGTADLLGDIDGINLGAVYDDSKTLAENLRAYYGAKPFRRFHNFLANAIDSANAPLFKLASSRGAKLDPAGKLRAGSFIQLFSISVVQKRKLDDKMSPDDRFDFNKMLEYGSPEMDAVIKYFFDFLEQGLAKE
jgi:N-acetylmuramoyl-L-alanine amidase